MWCVLASGAAIRANDPGAPQRPESLPVCCQGPPLETERPPGRDPVQDRPVAVASRVAAWSVALMAFGIDSVIELVAAFVVLQTFRAEQAGRSHRGEPWALRVIGVTFFLLAFYIVGDAGYTLVTASKPNGSV